MTYVMTDLHGEYEKYIRMLERIRFSDRDTLYINGDICDRGPRSAEIYLDVMERKNVLVVKGNHEVMAEENLEWLLREKRGNDPDLFELYSDPRLWIWFQNGGDTTVVSLYKESEERRRRILDFIKQTPYYRTCRVGDRHYVLVHGGLGSARLSGPEEVAPSELVWSRPDFDGWYLRGENTYLIVGHTPTILIDNGREKAKIYRGKGNVIALDCGAAYPEYQGRLGCLCLETDEEFYI
ncbi:MAG: serine/threonine protein phosphatase [Clostridia bacterium]|nr:serine/threonine protein phosphatase [Clostridia bacterium]